ncbi:EamA family transporter [Cohnella thailandensis]|uniref:EamA family transporter n=1 Tax=Cohnella thailandensis TaxID=557557 RepID=A0A841T5R3_9BACL|nr:EamA family transporter [Cohnella thailandensis]MBB6637207.1 EamA family transporter [Cohnella thailandensis]MBP1976971.1 drug/metabolite transporter (DMT)-like permease [Cohnella thailandensis]
MWFVFGLAAAICFGIRGILYQWTSQRRVNRSALLFGVYLSGMLVATLMNMAMGQKWTDGAWWGVLMGGFSFVANASMYKGYAVGKASLIALLTGLPPLVVALGAFALWGETLGLGQLAGFAIVLAGLIAIRYSSDLRIGQLHGLIWGLLTLFFFGFTDLTSKQSTISGAETLPTLILMYATGTLLFAGQWLLGSLSSSRTRREIAAAATETAVSTETAATTKTASPTETAVSITAALTTPSATEPASEAHKQASANLPAAAAWTTKRTVVWGMTVGLTNIAGMMFLIPAFQEGSTGIVSALGAMNAAIVLAYAKFYLKEEMRRAEAIGMALALGGIVVMRLAS